jgi:hypothetical protein
MKWHFSPQRRDQVETEVTQRDQFNNDDVDISETIIREAIQNSLDAAIDDSSTVSVTFSWLDKKHGLARDFFESLFEGQLEHAKAAELDIEKLDFNNPSALVIQDFGTHGLTGSVSEWDDNHFCDFWRRHGKSHKTGKSRGRWGLGKLVFSTTSDVGVFFGVTRRLDDNDVHLMGQTVLNLREVDGRRYPPHAFFADTEQQIPEDPGSVMTVPVKDQVLVSEFLNHFSIDRSSETGLSVVIPFPNESFSVSKMIEVAIANYFYPIITGKLLLQIDTVEINADNIRELAKRYAAHRFHQIDLLFDFIEEIYQAEQSHLLELKPSWLDDRKLDEDDFDSEVLEEVREKFSRGELVGLYLPVEVKPKHDENITSGFSVYLKKPDSLARGVDLYVRGGLTLPSERKFGDRRALGAMIAEEEPVCAFLGDAENAAHTKWTSNTEKLRKNYRSSQALITVIRNSVLNLYDLLEEVIEEVDEDALQSFFWFEEPETGKKRKRRKKPKPPDPIPPLPGPKPLFSLSKVEGGFTLTSTDDFTEDSLPREVKIEIAYEVPKGNAFKKYSPHDFKLGGKSGIECSVNRDSVKVISARQNVMQLEVISLPFRLTVKGFDPNRDLKIKVR